MLSNAPNKSPRMSDQGMSGPIKLNPNSKDAITTDDFLLASTIALAWTRPRKYISSMIASRIKTNTVRDAELIPNGKYVCIASCCHCPMITMKMRSAWKAMIAPRLIALFGASSVKR